MRRSFVTAVGMAWMLLGCTPKKSDVPTEAGPEPIVDAGPTSACRGGDVDLYAAFTDATCDLESDAGPAAVPSLVPEGLVMTLKLARDRIRAGERLEITVDLENRTGGAVALALDNST